MLKPPGSDPADWDPGREGRWRVFPSKCPEAWSSPQGSLSGVGVGGCFYRNIFVLPSPEAQVFFVQLFKQSGIFTKSHSLLPYTSFSVHLLSGNILVL